MKNHTYYSESEPYLTKDGSVIRELLHPDLHGNKNQSLAEAIIPPGKKTFLHLHKTSEEIYPVTQGSGLMTLGDEAFSIQQGDSICIEPGTAHCVENTGDIELKILCSCSPAYQHDDTELLE